MSNPLARAGRYEIVSELGRGAMGVVYEARDPVIGRTVAIKTMLTEGLAPSDYEAYRTRFQREAQSAGVLAHPNIVTIYDFGEDQGLLYLAMEFLKGKSLDRVAQEQNYLPLEKILLIYEQVSDALDFAHSKGVIHRDIKPPNIMILDNWQVKVTDFGIAKMAEMGSTGLTRSGQILGTPNYMSPEQVKGRRVDGRSDIFSLGVILYELVTGEKPFSGQNITTVIYKIMHENPIPPRDLDSAIHPGLSYVITKALAKSPDERYSTCRALYQDLKNYKNLGETPGLATPAMIEQEPAPAGAAVATPASALGPATTSSVLPATQRIPQPSAGPSAAFEPQYQAARAVPGIAPEPEAPPARDIMPRPAVPEIELPAYASPAERPAQERRKSPLPWLILTVLVIVAVGFGYWLLRQRKPRSVVISNGSIVVSNGGASATTATPAQSATPLPETPQPAPGASTTAPPPGEVQATQPRKASPPESAPSSAKHAALPAAKSASEPRPAAAEPAAVKVTVISDVPGAGIIVDGQVNASWTTPHTFSLPPGPHRFAVTKPGYKPVQKDVVVAAGSGQEVHLNLGSTAATPSPSGKGDAEIDIITNPPGLQVLIDGKPVGTTPVQYFTESGPHTCKVIPPPGGGAWEGPCEAKAGSVTTKKLNYNR